MNYDFKTDCDSNNNCNSNAKNSSEIDLDNLTFEFISEINDKLYEDLSNIANICNKFDDVKNTFFIDNEDCETTIDNEPNENIKDNNTLEDDYSKVIIAKKDKTIVGFISIYLIDESTAEICGFVLPEYRNNNIGNYLMEKLSYEMEDFYISIPVAKDNKTAPNFLKTNGYYPSTTECSMVINTDNIVEKPSSLDCSIDFKKTEKSINGSFEVNPENATQLLCGGTIYQVTSDMVSDDELGSYIDILAESVTFDTETKIPLLKEDLSKIDWYGENAGQGRENWFYTDIYEIYGTDKAEAVAVNVNDNYYIAKRQ